MDISFIITRSLKLAWRHKILWAAALLLGGASLNFNSSFNSDIFNRIDSDKEERSETSSPITLNGNSDQETGLSSVLGDTVENIDGTFNEISPPVKGPQFQNYLHNTLQSSIPNIVILVISFMIFIVYLILLSLLIKNWATGAMLGGIDYALEERSFGFAELGRSGRSSNKELIKFSVLTGFIKLLAVFMIVLPILVIALNDALTAAILIPLALFLPVLLFLVVISFAQIIGTRFIVIKGSNFKEALVQGFKVFKKNFVDALILNCANCFVTGLAFMLIMGVFMALVMGMLGLVSVSSSELKDIMLAVGVIFGVPIFIALISGMYAMGAYFATYNHFTWSMFFNFALKKEEENAAQ